MYVHDCDHDHRDDCRRKDVRGHHLILTQFRSPEASDEEVSKDREDYEGDGLDYVGSAHGRANVHNPSMVPTCSGARLHHMSESQHRVLPFPERMKIIGNRV